MCLYSWIVECKIVKAHSFFKSTGTPAWPAGALCSPSKADLTSESSRSSLFCPARDFFQVQFYCFARWFFQVKFYGFARGGIFKISRWRHRAGTFSPLHSVMLDNQHSALLTLLQRSKLHFATLIAPVGDIRICTSWWSEFAPFGDQNSALEMRTVHCTATVLVLVQ